MPLLPYITWKAPSAQQRHVIPQGAAQQAKQVHVIPKLWEECKKSFDVITDNTVIN